MVKGPKGTVKSGHIFPSLEVDHQPGNFSLLDEDPSAAGAFSGIISRPEDPLLLIQERPEIFFFPDMVTAGNHIGPGPENPLQGFLGHPESIRGIFPVYYRKIHRSVPDQAGKLLFQRQKPRLPHYIANHNRL
jgi:hypothetical protein